MGVMFVLSQNSIRSGHHMISNLRMYFAAQRSGAAAFFAFILLTIAGTPAGAISWGMTGPGTTNISVDDNEVTFTYAHDVRRLSGAFHWTISGGLFAPGLHLLDWTYSGKHNYGQSGTYLIFDGENLLPTQSAGAARSAYFSYSGRLAINAASYGKFPFALGGANDDTTRLMQGSITLKIATVPVPASALLLVTAISFGGLVSALKRTPKKTRRLRGAAAYA